MSQKLLKTLVATRPVLHGSDMYTEGQPYVARSDAEAKEMLDHPSWRKATKKDLDAWANRLTADPAIAYLRSLPAITEEAYETHPDDAAKVAEAAKADAKADAKAKAEAEAKAKAEADEKARLEAEAKAKAEADAAAGGANPVRSEGGDGGPEGGPAAPVTGPGGIG